MRCLMAVMVLGAALTAQPAGARAGNESRGDDAGAAKVSFTAKCAFEGNPVAIEVVPVEGHFPDEDSRRAAAEAACKPVLERANLECSLDASAIRLELHKLVDDNRFRARRAHLREQLKLAEGPRPAYCQ